MLPNIILLGFMGCGKTSVGRHLSALTGHRFVDTDDLVVRAANCSISEIFTREGETAFRDRETEALRELVGVCGIVLATGGGIILREENRALLPQIGVPIWLDAEPDLLFERVSRNQRRPLLATENPRATFDALLETRRPIYEAATIGRVDSTNFTHEQTARAILEVVRRASLC
jgi:shikimate kinase